MEEWADRCRRLVGEYQGSGLLPAGTSADALVSRLLKRDRISRTADDLWLLKEISPRLRPAGDTECIYEDSSYAEFAAPIAKLAEDVLGPVEIESRYDGHAEKAFLTFKARGREHHAELEQSTDYADIGGVLGALNQFVGPSNRLFYYIEDGDGYVGFLDESDAAFLKKKGYDLHVGGQAEDDSLPTPPPPKSAPSPVALEPVRPAEPAPSRRVALGGLIGLLAAGTALVVKTYVGLERSKASRKDAGPQGMPLRPGEIFTGRELFDQPTKLILEIRSYRGDLRASSTAYDVFKEDHTKAAERLKTESVEIRSGTIRRIEINAKRGALVWGVWNDGSEVATFDYKTLQEQP